MEACGSRMPPKIAVKFFSLHSPYNGMKEGYNILDTHIGFQGAK